MKQKHSISYCSLSSWFFLLMLLFVSACGGDDSPTSRVPVLTINPASGESSTQATLQGYVEDNGSRISECGFLVNENKGLLEKTGLDAGSKHVASRSADGTVKLQISNLTPNTTYYYCLYVLSGNTPIKSAISTFKTAEIGVPTFSDVQVVGEVGDTELKVSCRVTSDGGQAMQTLLFDYKLASESVFIKNLKVNKYDEGSTDNTFTGTINGLEPDTEYHIRASGSNGVKEGTSAILSVKTSSKSRPTVSILEIPDNNVGANYVTVSGKIENTGASAITERGFLIGTVSTPEVGSDGVTKVDVQAATNDFSATIENLSPATTYYVRAFAANNPYGSKTQYGYSEVKTITTKALSTPTFGTFSEQLVGTSLKVSCTVNNNGVKILEKGFCYSKTNQKPEVDNTANTIKAEDVMEATFPIEENTTYYIRAYVKYNLTGKEETLYSETHTSQKHTYTRPVFTETSSSDVSYTSAKLKAVLVDNGVTITEKGFFWGKTDKPDGTLLVTGNEFELTLTDLNPGTTYYFQPYVKITLAGKDETVKGETVASFTTLSVTKPELGAVNASQSNNVLQLSCPVTTEGVNATESGFCWSRSNTEPDVNNNTCVKGTIADGYLTASMNVEEYKTYYIRAYVKFTVVGMTDVVYSSSKRVDTQIFAKPTFSNVAHSEVTQTSAKLSALISPNGMTISEKGFVWGTTTNPTTKTKVTTDEYEVSLTGLTANTTYYYKAYATYKLGDKDETSYSEEKSFTTAGIRGATLTNPTVSDITFTTATVASSMTDQGDGELTKKGFCWIEGNATPTIENCTGTKELAADAEFKHLITGLAHGKKHTVRAYVVTQGSGQTLVSYSNATEFTTVAMTLATVDTPKEVEVTQAQFKVSSSVTNPGNTDVTEVGFCWSDQDVKPESMANKVKATQDDFVLTVSEGLKAGGTYYIYAYAVNSAGTAYSGKCTVTLKSIPGQGDNPYPGKE